MRIELLGVYPVEALEPCHLVELLIQGHVGRVDLSDFTQEMPKQPQSNWQVPWDERVLNADGSQARSGRYPREVFADGTPLRLVFFFHFLDFSRPLMTPAGEVILRSPEERPQRLAFLKYESPC